MLGIWLRLQQPRLSTLRWRTFEDFDVDTSHLTSHFPWFCDYKGDSGVQQGTRLRRATVRTWSTTRLHQAIVRTQHIRFDTIPSIWATETYSPCVEEPLRTLIDSPPGNFFDSIIPREPVAYGVSNELWRGSKHQLLEKMNIALSITDTSRQIFYW